jgi:hypothetical protein
MTIYLVVYDCQEGRECNRCGDTPCHVDTAFQTRAAAEQYIAAKVAEDAYVTYEINELEVQA